LKSDSVIAVNGVLEALREDQVQVSARGQGRITVPLCGAASWNLLLASATYCSERAVEDSMRGFAAQLTQNWGTDVGMHRRHLFSQIVDLMRKWICRSETECQAQDESRIVFAPNSMVGMMDNPVTRSLEAWCFHFFPSKTELFLIKHCVQVG
jgi:hypothetical protein